MSDASNTIPSNAEFERLTLLSNEAVAIVQAIGVIQSRGYDGSRSNLADKINELASVVWYMNLHGDIDHISSDLRSYQMMQRRERWMHYQNPDCLKEVL